MGQKNSRAEEEKRPNKRPPADWHEDPVQWVLIKTEALSCPLCYEQFVSTPLLLLCGHSFCRSCMLALLSNSNRPTTGLFDRCSKWVDCPLCRKGSVLHPKNLAKNFLLDSILDSCCNVSEEQLELGLILDGNLAYRMKQLAAENKQIKANQASLMREREDHLKLLKFYKIAIVGVLVVLIAFVALFVR